MKTSGVKAGAFVRITGRRVATAEYARVSARLICLATSLIASLFRPVSEFTSSIEMRNAFSRENESLGQEHRVALIRKSFGATKLSSPGDPGAAAEIIHKFEVNAELRTKRAPKQGDGRPERK